MNLYQSELSRKVISYGCTPKYNEDTKMLEVSSDNRNFVEMSEEGFLFYNQKELSVNLQNTLDKILDDARIIREYVGLYEKSKPMPFDSIKQYRKIGEYNDVVFGATVNDNFGFMFSSWRVDDDGNGVRLGNYSSDYISSKETFSVRSKLVDKQKLFTKEESELL